MAHFGQSDDFRRDELIRIIEHSVEKLTLAELEANKNMKNPQPYLRLRICLFTVLEQESPQVALEVRTYQVNHAHG